MQSVWYIGAARYRRLYHAEDRVGQYQCACGDDRRKGGRYDQKLLVLRPKSTHLPPAHQALPPQEIVSPSLGTSIQ